MSLPPWYNIPKDNVWWFVPSGSDAGPVSEGRQPLTNLLNNFSLNERGPKHALEQRKNIKAVADQENAKPWKKQEKVFPFRQHGHEVGCEKQEIKTIKRAIDDKKVKSHSDQEDTKFSNNPELLDSIYFHVKAKEDKNGLLFRRSIKINAALRSLVVDNLICVCENYNLDTETFHLAVFYMDKFLCLEEVDVQDMKLIELCAVFLASKFEEARNSIPELKDLIEHFHGDFSKKSVLVMEKKILKALNFDLSHPTAYYFLHIFCSFCDVKREEKLLAQCICDIALLYEDICFNIPPSQIAAAAIFLSNRLRGVKPMLDELGAFSQYEGATLQFTAKLLFSKYDKILSTEFHALKLKYGLSHYKNVLYTFYPRDLYI